MAWIVIGIVCIVIIIAVVRILDHKRDHDDIDWG